MHGFLWRIVWVPWLLEGWATLFRLLPTFWWCWGALNQEAHSTSEPERQKPKVDQWVLEHPSRGLPYQGNSTMRTWDMLYSFDSITGQRGFNLLSFHFAQPRSKARMTKADSDFSHTQFFFSWGNAKRANVLGFASILTQALQIFFSFFSFGFLFAFSLNLNEESTSGCCLWLYRFHTTQLLRSPMETAVRLNSPGFDTLVPYKLSEASFFVCLFVN